MTGRMRLRWPIAAVAWQPEVRASTVVVQVDPLAAYDRGSW